MISTCSGPTNGSKRSTVCWISERLPLSGNNCLGRRLRLSGQRRVPSPPARMATNRSPAPELAGTVLEELVGFGQALEERHLGFPAQCLLRQARVEHDTYDVACACRSEVRLPAVASDLG